MEIKNQMKEISLIRQIESRIMNRDGSSVDLVQDILVEHLLEVYVNERLTMRLVCTPQYLVELVFGRLLTEAIIETPEDIEMIYLCESGRRAKVYLKENVMACGKSKEMVQITPSCCTRNRLLDMEFVRQRELRKIKPLEWQDAWIFDLADRFAEGMPLHQRTKAAHSCFLSRKGEFLFSCEDLGRHNALDKVIGYALYAGIPLEECMVYTSGRVPVDMVTKAIGAGIPILVSKAAPTVQAIELAGRYGLTLITNARRDQMRIVKED